RRRRRPRRSHRRAGRRGWCRRGRGNGRIVRQRRCRRRRR
ncbi:PE family protein, partial [Mycobacterium tuberculosis]